MPGGWIRIERIANGWEMEFMPPEPSREGPRNMPSYHPPMKYAFDDPKKMLLAVGKVADKLKAKSAGGEYAEAFEKAVRDDD